VTLSPTGTTVLALGFGASQSEAVGAAEGSLGVPINTVLVDYTKGWKDYDKSLNRPPSKLPGLSGKKTAADLGDAYYVSANVIKASEDKTFAGAIVASLASPWGQAVSAGDPANTYFGSYREVFARDLYEAWTGLVADGDLATARAATLFLFERQQLPDGSMPRNSLVNGKVAPDSFGTQLDEASYPILMADQLGMTDASLYQNHVKPAANFVAAHGPSFGVERWEEQNGYSPSTIAAEIAGLTAASVIAGKHQDAARARLYQATADYFQRTVKSWTVTTSGPYGPRYFIRLSKTGDPNAAISYNLGNGGPDLDQRAVVDGGFQELVRLGELPVRDPDVQASLGVWDKQIAVSTPSGTGYYRYGNSAAQGSADGYGDCYQPSQTSPCTAQGAPWPPTNKGTGHLWPVLSGERAESDVAEHHLRGTASLLTAMENFSSGVGLVPEQAWENPDLDASPYGSDPSTASIGFTDGKAAGSASPLTWAQAQELRLILALATGRNLETPQFTTRRYVAHGAPGALNVTITAPANGSTLAATSTTVTGTTAPHAKVTVSAVDATNGASSVAVTTAAADGSFAQAVPIGFGSNVITVGASTHGLQNTGYAQVTVSNEGGGTTVLDVSDPSGDDNGPGTYQYPTDPQFHPGAFDLTRFQVLSDGTYAYVRVSLANLDPTFGQVNGAQMLDVYVHQPGAANTSTDAAFPQRNYAIGAGGWSQRVEAQAFAAPVWVDASGNTVGSPSVLPSQSDRTITIALPESALGTPAKGWGFTVVLTGQDGFSPDQARGFAPTPQGFLFGVCAPDGTAAICGVDPGTVPKAVDVITPQGVSQDTELDPTLGPVAIQPVTVP
jgi:glucoamylase